MANWKNHLPQIFGNISSDILRFIDRIDFLKEILQKDELLSSTSIGKIIQFFVKEAIKIGDKDEAFKSAIGLVYLNTLLEAIEYYNIEVNNLGISEARIFNVKNFEIERFFDNELVKFYEIEYNRVFSENGISKNDIKKIQSYINDNLKINFFQLLEDEPIVYEELIKELKSDKHKEELKKSKREIYKGYLKSRYEDVVFNNEKNLTLKDTYIDPYFRIHKNCFKSKLKLNENEKGFINFEDSIHNFIYNSFMGQFDKKLDKDNIQVIFILGYAGQGKSSFCKRFIYDVVTQKQPFLENIYFVELRNIPNPKELIEKPFDTLKEYIESETVVEDFNSSILILDGLDELFMKSGLASSDIDRFCLYLIENIKKQKIIVTSRYGYISLENRKLKAKNSLVIELQELTKLQQINWIEKYKKFFNGLYLNENKLNELYRDEDKYGHILELINQPILLYMMVTIGEFDENLNRSKLYNLVFDTLVDRQWAKDGIKESLKEILRRDLRIILQDIAIEIYQNDYEYIHKSRVEEIDSVEIFKKDLINIFNNDGLKDSLRALMISFYFKESKKDLNDSFREREKYNDYAIEFLHKSLMEYLVAEKIWAEVKKLDIYYEDERVYKIKDWIKAFEMLFELFSKKILSIEVVNYLIEVIENDKEENKKEVVVNRLREFFPIFLEKDFIYEIKINDKFSPHEAGLYTFYGFWTLLNHIKNENHLSDKIKEKFVYTLKAFINLNTNQFNKTDNMFLFFLKKNKNILNLSKQNLISTNLISTNLSNAELSNTDLSNANLSEANLSNANLSEANLSNANLFEINLFEANLNNTNLSNTNLFNANLSETNLSNANLSNANLSNANLNNANLEGVDFTYSKNLDKAIGIPKYTLEKWKKVNKK